MLNTRTTAGTHWAECGQVRRPHVSAALGHTAYSCGTEIVSRGIPLLCLLVVETNICLFCPLGPTFLPVPSVCPASRDLSLSTMPWGCPGWAEALAGACGSPRGVMRTAPPAMG